MVSVDPATQSSPMGGQGVPTTKIRTELDLKGVEPDPLAE